MAHFLRADVTNQVHRAVRVPVGMAVEACDSQAGTRNTAIVGRIELLLRERRQEQAQTIKLFRVEQFFEECEVVVDSDELALRDVAHLRMGG